MRSRKDIERELGFSGFNTYGAGSTLDESIKSIGEILLDIRDLLSPEKTPESVPAKDEAVYPPFGGFRNHLGQAVDINGQILPN